LVAPATGLHSSVLAPGHRLGRYEILAKLAAGGMAIVYVARAHGAGGFERLVALKVLHANLAYEDEFIKMFLDEARLAARIRHPNVVPTIDISDTIQTGFFLVMDYIEGDHLGALLSGAHKAGTRVPVGVALRILVDALGGLGAAHALTDESGKLLNLVHRDVSPHNIMVGLDGIARLTDFGVAKAEDRLTHTRDGQVKGKLAYMAPEQASSGQSGSRSDIFSAGIILWECLTGRRLFRAESTAATLHKLLHGEIAPPSMVDPELAPLDPILKRALDRNPDNRFATAEEFAEALERVAPELGGLASSRTVSRAVAEFAEAKLERERKLIDDAKRALSRKSGDAPFEADAISEPSSASLTFSSSSLSFSKLSGVYSSATTTGLKTSAPPPTPPPALGTFDATSLPPLPSASPPAGSPARRLALILLLLVGGAAGALWWLRDAKPQPQLARERSEAVEPRAAPPVVESDVPEPAAAATQVQQPGPQSNDAVAEPTTPVAIPQRATREATAAPVRPASVRPSAKPSSVRPKRRKPARKPPVELIDNPYRR
jgi:serine/threonine-protein kinase